MIASHDRARPAPTVHRATGHADTGSVIDIRADRAGSQSIAADARLMTMMSARWMG